MKKLLFLFSIVGTIFLGVQFAPSFGAEGTCSGSYSWTELADSEKQCWLDIAASANGIKLAAIGSNGSVYTSVDSGTTWTRRVLGGQTGSGWSVATSSDGTKIFVTTSPGKIYSSLDSGNTWTETSSVSGFWREIASSSNGINIVAINSSNGYIYTSSDGGMTWSQRTSAGIKNWRTIVSSSDGTKLAATTAGGYIYTSSDGGATWIERTAAGGRNWADITISSDGTKLAANVIEGYIYTSNDGGATWAERMDAGNRTWRTIVMSFNGLYLVAGGDKVNDGYIYISKDFGVTWTKREDLGQKNWHVITLSSDGIKLIAGDTDTPTGCSTHVLNDINETSGWSMQKVHAGPSYWYRIATSSDGSKIIAIASSSNYAANTKYIYTSSDGGISWIQKTALGQDFWVDVASSADGTKLVAVMGGPTGVGYIYTSIDSGNTWTRRDTAGAKNWYRVASSADGLKIVAAAFGSYIYTSSDGGITWTERTSVGQRNWSAITSSSDGNRLAVSTIPRLAYTSPDSNGYIYTSSDGGITWTERTSVGQRNWSSVASSTDGVKLVATVEMGGYIYISSDSGVTWTEKTSVGPGDWRSSAISSDGTKIAVGGTGAGIYTSSDVGATWVKTANGIYWWDIAASSDGSKFFAATFSLENINTYHYNIYKGTATCACPINATGTYPNCHCNETTKTYDSATNTCKINATCSNGSVGLYTWTERTSAGIHPWRGVASSSDGTKLSAVATSWGATGKDYIYTSTDGGATWNMSANAGQKRWYAIASSSDGTKLAAVEYKEANFEGSYLYTSSDGGVTWEKRDNAGKRDWEAIASSADGSRLVAVDWGYIYTSSDFGATWTEHTNMSGYNGWGSDVASSADGLKLVAVTGGYHSLGYIYTSTDGGNNWTRGDAAGAKSWYRVTISSDGTKLAAVQSAGGPVYTSSDGGITWTGHTVGGTGYWDDIVSSADGDTIVALGRAVLSTGTSFLYISRNGGETWTEQAWTGSGLSGSMYSIALSSDGSRIVGGILGGPIFTGVSSCLSCPTEAPLNNTTNKCVCTDTTKTFNPNTNTCDTTCPTGSTGTYPNNCHCTDTTKTYDPVTRTCIDCSVYNTSTTTPTNTGTSPGFAYGNVVSVSTTPGCFDSDGLDYFNKGYRTMSGITTDGWAGYGKDYDYCVSDSYSGYGGTCQTGESCFHPGDLIEYACVPFGWRGYNGAATCTVPYGCLMWFGYTCPSGYSCQDGACKAGLGTAINTLTTSTACVDNDGGSDYGLKTKAYIFQNGSIIKSAEDACTSASSLKEITCTSSSASDVTETIFSCGDRGCFNGACGKQIDYAASDGPRFNCSDSDGGGDLYQAGTTYGSPAPGTAYGGSYGNSISQTDHCLDSQTLEENSCVLEDSLYDPGRGDAIRYVIGKGTYTCPYGCSNGACNLPPDPPPAPAVNGGGTGSVTIPPVCLQTCPTEAPLNNATNKCVCSDLTKTYNTTTKSCDLVCPANTINTYPACRCTEDGKDYQLITNSCIPKTCPTGSTNTYPNCDCSPLGKQYSTLTNTCTGGCIQTQAPSQLQANLDQPLITCRGDTTHPEYTHFKYRLTKEGSTNAADTFTSPTSKAIGTYFIHPALSSGTYTVQCFYGTEINVDTTSNSATPHGCAQTITVTSDQNSAQGCRRIYPYRGTTLSDEMINESSFQASFRCGSRLPLAENVANPYLFSIEGQDSTFHPFDALISDLFNGLEIGPVSTQTSNYSFGNGTTSVSCAVKVGNGYSTSNSCQLNACVGSTCSNPKSFAVFSGDSQCTSHQESSYNIGCNPASSDFSQCVQGIRDAITQKNGTMEAGKEYSITMKFGGPSSTDTTVLCTEYTDVNSLPADLKKQFTEGNDFPEQGIIICKAQLESGETIQIYASDTSGRSFQTSVRTRELDTESPRLASIKYYTNDTLSTEVSNEYYSNKPVTAVAVCSDTPANEDIACACAKTVYSGSATNSTTNADEWSQGIPNNIIGADLMRYTRRITQTVENETVTIADTADNTSTTQPISFFIDTEKPIITLNGSAVTSATNSGSLTITAQDISSHIWPTTATPTVSTGTPAATNKNGILYRIGPKSDQDKLAFDENCDLGTTITTPSAFYAKRVDVDADIVPEQTDTGTAITIPANQILSYCVKDNAGNVAKGFFPRETDSCFAASNMPTVPTFDTHKELMKSRIETAITNAETYGYTFSENADNATCFRTLLNRNIGTLIADQYDPIQNQNTLSNWTMSLAKTKTDDSTNPGQPNTNGYYYYDYTDTANKTLSITTNPSGTGQKTVIVEGGDIKITQNIIYTNMQTNDSDTSDSANLNYLLLIARKDNEGNGGNIKITPNVTHIDAILIADGGALISEDPINSGNRLTVNGRIYSYNTRGGSYEVDPMTHELTSTTIPRIFTNNTLTSMNITLEEAQKQDLEHFRTIDLDGTNTCSLYLDYYNFTTGTLPPLLRRPDNEPQTGQLGECSFW